MTVAVLLCSAAVHAYDFEVDGIYYNTISSTDFTVGVTHGDNKYSGNITIPSTVTYKSRILTVISIESSAFSVCDNLYSVTIPNSVTDIKYLAFNLCKSLSCITIPNSVTRIDEGAFYKCI